MPTQDKLTEAKDLITNAQTVTVITGAGISTDSGIPDFRGPNGIWTKDPDAEKITDIHHYKTSPKIRQKTWDGYVRTDWSIYKPNAGHEAIKKLYDDEKLLVCITQNIDGLHLASGIPPVRLVELHGHLRDIVCIGCGHSSPSADDMECTQCGGLMKPNVVMFGENLDSSKYHKAEAAVISCDVLLVVGTTLLVWPVADLPLYAQKGGIPVIYVNGSPPPIKTTVNLIGSISEILPQIV